MGDSVAIRVERLIARRAGANSQQYFHLSSGYTLRDRVFLVDANMAQFLTRITLHFISAIFFSSLLPLHFLPNVFSFSAPTFPDPPIILTSLSLLRLACHFPKPVVDFVVRVVGLGS